MAKANNEPINVNKHFWLWVIIGVLWGFGLSPVTAKFGSPMAGVLIGALLGVAVGLAVASYAKGHKN